MAFRETLGLRKIVAELTEGEADFSLSMQLDAGRLLYDVCCAIGLDPWSVLDAMVMTRLLDEDVMRLWPTLAKAEDEEMAETDAIRETGISDGFYQLIRDDMGRKQMAWRTGMVPSAY